MAWLYVRVDGRVVQLRGNAKDVEAVHDALTGRVPDMANGWEAAR